jgi:hypothetical protein
MATGQQIYFPEHAMPTTTTSGNRHCVWALGICGIIPYPGHNVAQFETSHTLASDSDETIAGHRVQ